MMPAWEFTPTAVTTALPLPSIIRVPIQSSAHVLIRFIKVSKPRSHCHRHRGTGGHVPPIPQNSGKIYLGNYYVQFGHFSGKNRVKFGHFVNFSYIFFGQKCRAPLKLTELLRLWSSSPLYSILELTIDVEPIQSNPFQSLL